MKKYLLIFGLVLIAMLLFGCAGGPQGDYWAQYGDWVSTPSDINEMRLEFIPSSMQTTCSESGPCQVSLQIKNVGPKSVSLGIGGIVNVSGDAFIVSSPQSVGLKPGEISQTLTVTIGRYYVTKLRLGVYSIKIPIYIGRVCYKNNPCRYDVGNNTLGESRYYPTVQVEWTK